MWIDLGIELGQSSLFCGLEGIVGDGCGGGGIRGTNCG